jgi:hypothetical protein
MKEMKTGIHREIVTINIPSKYLKINHSFLLEKILMTMEIQTMNLFLK